MIGTLALLSTSLLARGDERAYVVEDFPSPEGARLEVGGLGFLPDGRLVVSTRRGQVWILANPLVDDVAQARWSLFAEGLQEGLGLAVADGELFVLQRGELSRLADADSDGVCDRIDTLTNGWGLSGNYHEFAFGLPVDRDGDFVVTLNVAFLDPHWWHGQSIVPWRGWALKVSRDGDVRPWAHGFRSPCGVGTDADGEVFVTDNQGDWVASSPIYHLVEGGFYGHPASLDWTEQYRSTATRASDEVPPPVPRRPAAIWIPYGWSRSTGNLVADTSGGAFGPFEGQLFVAELTNGKVLRAGMERVHGDLQGWIVPFLDGVGSVCRVAFGPDGSLFCGRTNRGWGGRPPSDGLARVRWTGAVPFEIERVHLTDDGFEVSFTEPVAGAPPPEAVELVQYRYNYWWEYGSPEVDHTRVAVEDARLLPNGRTLALRAPALEPARVARITLPELVAVDGSPLVHREVAYTVNQMPGRERTDEHVCKVVPPPPSKESGQEGWLMLTWGSATDLWKAEGWELCGAELDPDDPTRFLRTEGDGALVNAGEGAAPLRSRPVFGDAVVHLGYLLPEGSRGGVYLLGRYELPLEGDPGIWHEVDALVRAPRFDAAGNKTANARLERVLVNDVLVRENVELAQPSPGAPLMDEGPSGPIAIRGDAGLVAVRDVRAKPIATTDEGSGWKPVFPAALFDDWIADEDAEWEFDGVEIVSSGPRGHLFSPRGDYVDFDLRARVKVSDGGKSGLYFRATPTGAWPEGYEAQVNSSFPDPQKTGSLYGIVPVATHLVPADTWFDYFVSCRDTEEGTHVVIRVNGVTITDVVDRERRYARGHVALQQHHEGSVVSFRDVEIREY